MKLHCISEHDYNKLAFKLIFSNCGFSSSLSISASGYPSIGYNFNLQDDRILMPVLVSLGFDVYGKTLEGEALEAEHYYVELLRSAFKIVNSQDTESLNNVVQSILAARLTDNRYSQCGKYKRIARFAYEGEVSFVACLSYVLKNYEKTVDQWLMSFDMEIVTQNPKLLARKSRERAVLLSLAYQGIIGFYSNRKPKFPALGNALIMNDRPLVWYYIRYNAFGGDEENTELVKKRYFESELFGLYDQGVNSENITSEQCKDIYNTYHEYKEHIIEHERRYSAKILEANQQFDLYPEGAIKTLEQNFAIAYNHIRNTKTVTPLSEANKKPLKPQPWVVEKFAKEALHLERLMAG